jgi:hypothetical protein
MKRFVSLDFLRGLAIIGMVCFHIMQVTYNFQAILASNFPIPLYIPLVLFYYIGEFDILFITLSGIVNTISIDRQWQKILQENPSLERKRIIRKKILKIQLLRGLFLLIISYFADCVLNNLLVNIIAGKEYIKNFIGILFHTGVITAIALGTIFSSLIYVPLLCSELKPRMRIKILFWIIVGFFAITPFMEGLAHTFPQFYDNWEQRTLSENIIYLFLTPIFKEALPFFPNAAFTVLGTLIGTQISEGSIQKSLTNKWIFVSLGIFLFGIPVYLLKKIIVLPPEPIWSHYALESMYEVGKHLMVLGGALLGTLLLLYLIDVRGKGPGFAKYTETFRRFGLFTLTIYSLQWFLMLIFKFFHFIIYTDPRTVSKPIDFLDSPFLNQGLSGFATIFWSIVSLVIIHGILLLWEKVGYKGTLEWLIAKILARKRIEASGRMEMTQFLYNVESIISQGQSYYNGWIIFGLWAIFFSMELIFAIVTLFL